MKKALSFILAAVLICTFAIPVFAGEGYIIDNSLLCLTVPVFFTGDIEPTTSSYFYSNYHDCSLDILVCDNTRNTVAATDETDKLISDMKGFILDTYADYTALQLNMSKTKINGLTAAVGTGKQIFDYGDRDTSVIYSVNYMFTTEENVILLMFEKDSAKMTAEELAEVTKCAGSFIMNGTYTGGDALTVEHDFTSAEPFDLDKFYYGDYEDDDDFIGEIGDDDAIVMAVFRVICILFSLPTIGLIIAAIVLGVKYSKKKKQLKEYKRLYGEIPPNVNYYGNQGGYNPQYNAPQGYDPQYNQPQYNPQQNFYGAPQQPQNPQGFNQQFGSAPAGQPQYNQPAQPVQQAPQQNYVSIFSADEQNKNIDEEKTEE